MTPQIRPYPLETLRRNLQAHAPGGLMAGVSASGLMLGV